MKEVSINERVHRGFTLNIFQGTWLVPVYSFFIEGLDER